MTVTTEPDQLDTSTCPSWCNHKHDSVDHDNALYHEGAISELTVRDNGFPDYVGVSVGLGQSTAEAVAGVVPTITLYVNDDNKLETVGAELSLEQAEQLAANLTAAVTAAR
jgi:hypothetical protein